MKQKVFLSITLALLVGGAGCSSSTPTQPVAEQTTVPVTAPTSPTDQPPTAEPAKPVTMQTAPAVKTTIFTKPFAMTIDAKKQYSAVLHTSAGDITIAFNAAMVPNTVNNFVNLAKNNFYDNTIFHRVLKGFMIQGGDPDGNGTGGPGYRFDDEPFQGEYTRGTVAMANAGPNTNGSQFFIMHADYPLPKSYVIFGKVTSGLDVVDKIAIAAVRMSASGEPSQPVNPVTVKSVEIMVK